MVLILILWAMYRVVIPFHQGTVAPPLMPEFNQLRSWNTAATPSAPRFPTGLVFNVAERKLMGNRQQPTRIWTAQNWLMIHRILDDYYFHGLNRLKVNKFFNQNNSVQNTG
jgi:hypothetical protein